MPSSRYDMAKGLLEFICARGLFVGAFRISLLTLSAHTARVSSATKDKTFEIEQQQKKMKI